jgi:Spy/CpxP family protein refolding chaperone
MNRKFLAVLTGAIVTLTPGLIGLVPAAQAQTIPFDTIEDISGIQLTPQQQEQLTQISRQVQSQVAGILTPQQQTQWQQIKAQRQAMRQAIAQLNLTSSQKSQLQQIFRTTRGQVSTILTPEQKRQLQQTLRSRIQNR